MERRIVACLIIAVLAGAALFADDKDSSRSQPPNPDLVTALLQRIEALEHRVAKLEKQSSPATLQYPTTSRSASPVPQGFQPRHLYQPSLPNAYPADTPASQTPPINTPDRTWQKLEVNGHTFYIVPAAQMTPKVGMPIVQPNRARR